MLDKFKQHLRDHGQSLTEPRLATFAFLQDNDSTTTSAVIEHLVPKYDRASLYRSLKLFRHLDIIKDIVVGGRRMIELTDTFDQHHHHLVCTECGQSLTFTSPEIEQLIHRLAAQNGFQAGTHHIEIDGLCGACRPSLTPVKQP
jgi:Fur family transcriptional regulator, ferric uptake regulator